MNIKPVIIIIIIFTQFMGSGVIKEFPPLLDHRTTGHELLVTGDQKTTTR